MAKKPLPTPELLRQLLRYEPLTGKLFWRTRPIEFFEAETIEERQRKCNSWNRNHAGDETFFGIDGAGYRQGRILGRWLKAHRVIWAIYFGRWPEGEVGRHNGDNQDNRIANLRDTDHAGIMRNSRMSKCNTSGVTGVSWDRKCQKWQAGIRRDGKSMYLGKFENFEDAVQARKRAEIEAGYHPSHGERRTTSRSYIPKIDR